MKRSKPALVGEPVEPDAWIERVFKKRILVHLDTDQSIQGVLMEQTEDGLILRAAKLLSNEADVEDTMIAGETFVPAGRVVFAQLDD